MTGVVVKTADVGMGIGQKGVAVKPLHRLQRRQSRADGFAAAGKSGHIMRLHQAGRQAKTSLDKPSIQLDRAAGPTFKGQLYQIARFGIVILDLKMIDSLRSENLQTFLRRAGAMHAGGDKNDDLFPLNPCF